MLSELQYKNIFSVQYARAEAPSNKITIGCKATPAIDAVNVAVRLVDSRVAGQRSGSLCPFFISVMRTKNDLFSKKYNLFHNTINKIFNKRRYVTRQPEVSTTGFFHHKSMNHHMKKNENSLIPALIANEEGHELSSLFIGPNGDTMLAAVPISRPIPKGREQVTFIVFPLHTCLEKLDNWTKKGITL